MKTSYEIVVSVHGTPVETIPHTQEGKNYLDCDNKAKAHFIESYVKNEKYEGKDLGLHRIEELDVPDKKTCLVFDSAHSRAERLASSQ
jgi:hypothetical protein